MPGVEDRLPATAPTQPRRGGELQDGVQGIKFTEERGAAGISSMVSHDGRREGCLSFTSSG